MIEKLVALAKIALVQSITILPPNDAFRKIDKELWWAISDARMTMDLVHMDYVKKNGFAYQIKYLWDLDEDIWPCQDGETNRHFV